MEDSQDMSRESTIVGSEDGYRLRLTNDDPMHDDATETSGLLGAGAQENSVDGTTGEDTWNGMEDFEGLPWWRKPSVYWLVGPYAIFTLAFGGVLVPKLNLIIDLVCQKYLSDKAFMDPVFTFAPVIPGADNPQCRKMPEVQRSVATFSLIISVIVGTLSAITAPRLGSLSDRYGRKKIMVITSSGGLLGEVITILAANYPDVISYQWLIAASVVDGLAGSFTAGSVVSHSYTSDCTPPSKRAVAFGYMHACLFTGMAFGPLLAGYFVEWTDSLLSIFYVTLGCHIVFILYIVLILPESVSKKRQMLAREKHAREQERLAHQNSNRASVAAGSLLSSVNEAFLGVRKANPLAPLKILIPRGLGTAKVRRNLILLAAIDTILIGAAMSSGAVTLLYTEYMFDWGNFETSLFISLISMVRVVVLMGIFPIINYTFRTLPARRRLRESGIVPIEKSAGADDVDVWIIRTAIISDVLGVVGYIFVRTPQLFVVCAVVTAFGGLGSATIQSSLTKHVPPERVGELLGAVGLLHAISRIFAPMLFNGLYAATVESFPQAIYCLVAAFFTLVLVLSFLIRPHVFLKDSYGPPSPTRRRTTSASDDQIEDDIVPQMP